MVAVDPRGPTFHLTSAGTSYVITVIGGRHLAHAYWGGRLSTPDPAHLVHLVAAPYLTVTLVDADENARYQHAWAAPEGALSDPGQVTLPAAFSPDLFPAEYPTWGTGSLGEPAILVRAADGSWATGLEYRRHHTLDALPGPDGLPYVTDLAGPAQTLRIELADPHSTIRVELYYAPLAGLGVILRWSRVTNDSNAAVDLSFAASASMDLPRADLDMITLNGAWARERNIHRSRLSQGLHQVDSRGGASGHQHAPFVALAEPTATEEYGAVWSTSLLYSGNHVHRVHVTPYGHSRLQSGINPLGFGVTLPPGSSFDTPAAALVHSSEGLGGMSRRWHDLARRALIPERWRDTDRPIVINTWEAHYFDVDEEKVAALADRGAEIGAEVLVLDDGWFVGRRDDTRALGDWCPDPEKFPGGLKKAADAVTRAGLRFGLWVEPEMVSPDSNLLREHPDWTIGIPEREPSMARNQLVLDLSRGDVLDHLTAVLTQVLESAPVSYVKWDMNRNMSEPGSRTAGPDLQPGVMHRNILGLYDLLSRLTERFPDVMFEGCAGGGGRMDLGMMCYTPVFWASDQTDGVERQRIQAGTSLLFPPETIGAHVSAVPNHQVGRNTPAITRGLTALGFAYGYELDLEKLTNEERALYPRLSEMHRRHRRLFRTGTFLRLDAGRATNPVTASGRTAWMFVSPDRDEAAVFFFQTLVETNMDGGFLRVRGLDETAAYRDVERDVVFDAALLQNRGLWLPPATGDYRSAYWIFKREDPDAGLGG